MKADISNDTKAYCSVCKKVLNAHKKGLTDHAGTNSHKFAAQNGSDLEHYYNQDRAYDPIDEKRKVAELKIACFIAEHCAINSVDHLGKLLSDLDDESRVLSQLKIHRTKCTGSKKWSLLEYDIYKLLPPI